MEIRLEKCTLRRWRAGDERSLVRHADNYKIWRNVRDRFPHPYTLEDARLWIEYAGSADPQTDFAIEVEGEAAGAIGIILQTDIYRRSAEIGYWLGEKYWGRGIVTSAVRAMTDWAFANFDICRIYAGVLEWNPTSMKVLEKAGYRFEARLSLAVTKENVTMDDFIYSIIRK